MRVLSITAQKPDSTGSGVYLSEIVNSLQRKGHLQAVVAGITKEDKPHFPDGVEKYFVYYETKELPYAVLGMSDEMPYRSTKYSEMTDCMTAQLREQFWKVLSKAVEEFQPDIILSHHLYYVTAMVREKFRHIRVFGICHGSDLRQIKKNSWERNYILSQIKELDGIFALHEEQKAEVSSLFSYPKEKIHVLGIGYNCHIFHKIPDAEKNKEQLEILFAGKVSEKKGVMSLIRAMDHISEKEHPRLLIAGGFGNQEEYDKIKTLARHAKCDVEFLGKLSQPELAYYMSRCQVFALPSFYEGLPLTIIEAMSCGAKVVCSDLPGIQKWIRECLPEHSCIFVPVPDRRNEDEPIQEQLPQFEKNVADAIVKASRLESVPAEKIERLSWDGLAKRLQEFF